MTWSFSKTKGFFCFSFNNRCRLENCSRAFWHTLLLEKRRANQPKNIQGDVFLFNWKQHAKFQALLQKKEKHLAWFCTQNFNYTNLRVYRNLSRHATWHWRSYQIALKQGNQNAQNNMIESFSFTSMAHVRVTPLVELSNSTGWDFESTIQFV